MRINHKIDDFLNTIFPNIMGGGNLQIINTLEKYYTYGPYKPKVTIENEWVSIEIDTPTILTQEADFRQTVALCEKGKYTEAKTILSRLIEKNPSNSEYYRIMGQILSDEGAQDNAINCLIDSLRWDSKNGWALTMMGNIFSRFKNDIPTAMKYYNQALIANPSDYITFTNIGVNLLQQRQLQDAKRYFIESLKINGEFPNTHHALGMVAEMENELQKSFEYNIAAIKLSKTKDAIYLNSVNNAVKISEQIVQTGVAKGILNEYRKKLIAEGGTEIEIVEDEKIPTAARMEFAENYKRQHHVVRYKPSYPAAEHLVMHEMVHLDFVIEARNKNLNQVFFSNSTHKSAFEKEMEPSFKRIRKKGHSEEAITDFLKILFSALNHQIYNTPIDLFIEDFLYSNYPVLRPYQFLSLLRINQDGLKAVTDEKVIELTPKHLLSKVKVYNLINITQFTELFGVDFISDYKASPAELKQAREFYDEYKEYKEDREPGEEYELVINWAEDLKLTGFFELEGETQYRNRTNMDTFYKNLEEDPMGLDEINPAKERAMERFRKAQQNIGINMAVAEYMVEALRFFDEKPKERIKRIAAEIAMQGSQGFNPEIRNYSVIAIPGKLFSGYQIMAWCYVGFALAIPELLSQLELPYDEEYKYALAMI